LIWLTYAMMAFSGNGIGAAVRQIAYTTASACFQWFGLGVYESLGVPLIPALLAELSSIATKPLSLAPTIGDVRHDSIRSDSIRLVTDTFYCREPMQEAAVVSANAKSSCILTSCSRPQ